MQSDVENTNPNILTTARRVVGRILTVLIIFVLSVLLLGMGAIYVVCKGPSDTMRDIFVSTVMETSAAKFLAKIYLSEDEIEAILEKTAVVELDEVTEQNEEFEQPAEKPKELIEIVDVKGTTFRGKMMIVHDPSRVTVATLSEYGMDKKGKRVDEFVRDNNAIAGVNGGGFEDPGGSGTGGMPVGIVIKDGKLVFGSEDQVYKGVIGFDNNNRLVVGSMSGRQALERGLRDALNFGPVLVVNGKPNIAGESGSLNPRTCIGQRSDGAVLLLVIDGRQTASLGANYKDCQDVMLQFGAINAANLDGGSSSLMYYKGEVINVSASITGSRRMATAVIVK